MSIFRAYDALDRVAAVTDPRGGVTRVECDTSGEEPSVTRADGTAVLYWRDAHGRLIYCERSGCRRPRKRTLTSSNGSRCDTTPSRRVAKEVRDPALPKVLLLIPHLGKKPIKTAKEAKTIADYKAQVKWEKPAASGARNNLVVPLCYDAPWLNGRWY